MPTPEKVSAVEELRARLDGVKTVMLTEYRGLTVQQLAELRKQLRAVSAEYKVVKNRLARLAISASDLKTLSAYLTGPTGFVFSKQDPVAVAKALHTFARTNQALAIKAGYVEGQMLPPTELRALADLPSKGALRSQLVGAVQGAMAQLVGLLTAPQRELVYVLEHGSASRAGASGEASGEMTGKASASRAGASGEASGEMTGKASASQADASGEASGEMTGKASESQK